RRHPSIQRVAAGLKRSASALVRSPTLRHAPRFETADTTEWSSKNMQTRTERRPAWPERDLKHSEKRLLEERRRATAQAQQFDHDMGQTTEDGEGEITGFRLHMADEGTETYEREQRLLMASREGR